MRGLIEFIFTKLALKEFPFPALTVGTEPSHGDRADLFACATPSFFCVTFVSKLERC